MQNNEDALGVSADLALDLPRRERATVEREAGDATGGLLVRVLVVAHVVLDDREHVVLAGDDGAVREGEGGVDVIVTIEESANELIVDKDRGRES